MRVTLEFGAEPVTLDLEAEQLVELLGGDDCPSIADVAGAVTQAIEQPLAFPSPRRAVVPGDHVAFVLDYGIPQPAELLAPLVEHLVGAAVQPVDIVIVEVPHSKSASNGLTADAIPPGIRLVRHDSLDRDRLSYLASTKSGERIYLNRDVVDADLVVLVGRVDYHSILNYRGTGSGLFPGLADDATQKQFRRQITAAITKTSQRAARHEVDEVAWLLGIQFAVQVVLGRGSEIVSVLAGRCGEVQQESERRLDRFWNRTASRRAELVVAAISDKPKNQGFEQLGLVLETALGLVQDGGRIVVFSSLDAVPGVNLSSAQKIQDPAKIMDHVRSHPEADAISTWQIASACRRCRVYLHSRLPNEFIEDLAMTPIDSAAEVQQLVKQVSSCMILNDAQLARVTVESKDDKSTG